MTHANTVSMLLGGINQSRVTRVSLVFGVRHNQRIYENDEAQRVIAIIQSFQGQHIGSDRIQPWTWDFENWQARIDVTPLIFMATVREAWTAWEDRIHRETRETKRVPVDYLHITGFAIYDVRQPTVFEARQWQGNPAYEERYHANSIQIPRDQIEALMHELGLTE